MATAVSPATAPDSGPTATLTATASATPTVASSPTPFPTTAGPRDEPLGFPVEPMAVTGLVKGAVGSRVLAFDEGPPVLDYSRDDQPSSDPVRANRAGWNARVHVEYEGQPAVDWYLPVGTPVLATMDGRATLLINTVSNPFDVSGVSREPYIGNPDRSRAPLSPFPGPGGGQGAFVRIESAIFRADSAHLEIARTLAVVPAGAFLAGYSGETDYLSLFGPLRDFRLAAAVASWQVRRGDVIGFTGDSGYSEAPHLHYAIGRTGSAALLCPTIEPGFPDPGRLFR